MGQEVVGKSALLTVGLVERALRLAEPSIMALFAEKDPTLGDPDSEHKMLLKRDTIAIVVADGTALMNEGDELVVLADVVLNNPAASERFRGIARSKATVSWRGRCDSRDVATIAPQLLREGDTIYEGARFRNGIIVAASGVQSYFDAAIADIVMAIIEGLIRNDMASLVTSDVDYIPRVAA